MHFVHLGQISQHICL